MSRIELDETVVRPATELCDKVSWLNSKFEKSSLLGPNQFLHTPGNHRLQREIRELLGSLLVLLAYHTKEE